MLRDLLLFTGSNHPDEPTAKVRLSPEESKELLGIAAADLSAVAQLKAWEKLT